MAAGGFIFKRRDVTRKKDAVTDDVFRGIVMDGYVQCLIEASGGVWGGEPGYWRIDRTRHTGSEVTDTFLGSADYINCDSVGGESSGVSVFFKSVNNESFVIIVYHGSMYHTKSSGRLAVHRTNLPVYSSRFSKGPCSVGFAYCPSGVDFSGTDPGIAGFCPAEGTRLQGIFTDDFKGYGDNYLSPSSPLIVDGDFRFCFGMCVRGNIIIPMFRCLSGEGAAHLSWRWFMLGEIFDVMVNEGDTDKVGVFGCYTRPLGWRSYPTTDDLYPLNSSSTSSNMWLSWSTSLSLPLEFHNSSTISERISFTGNLETGAPIFCYFLPFSSDDFFSDGVADLVPYAAVYACVKGTDESAPMVNGGYSGKGYLNTDAVRVTARSVTLTPGTLYDGGNFINFGCDVVIGWDPSNENPFSS